MEDIIKFKNLLQYFVCHLEFCNNDYKTESLNETRLSFINDNGINNVKPGSGRTTGQGYKGDKIQKQIEEWCDYPVGRVCISVQKSPKGGYKTLASYLHWDGTDLNINAEWQEGQISLLYYRNRKNGQRNDSSSISVSELFSDNDEKLKKLFDMFVDAKKNAIDNKILDLVSILEYNHNLILTGAPGTGKTFLTWKIAEKIITMASNNPDFEKQYKFVQFHPSYDYTDFVEGLRPTDNNSFVRQNGVFKDFCAEAAKTDNKQKKYVFVIDEINRGEISKIFGELFFSIDPGYRGEKDNEGRYNKVNTQYQNLINPQGDDIFRSGFYVPENVYIIGTMNDIDRSVESMDFAFRRRFAFEEVTAAESESMVYKKLNSNNGWTDQIVGETVERMRNLNYAIVNPLIGGLTQQYQIGGAYFIKLDKVGFDFQKLWNVFLKGVLYEYFRGQPDASDKLSQFEDAYNLDDGKVKKTKK